MNCIELTHINDYLKSRKTNEYDLLIVGHSLGAGKTFFRL